MDKEAIAKATPFVERKLADQRKRNKIAIVKSILATESKSENITPEWVSKQVKEEYNIDLDTGQTDINSNSALKSLEEENIVSQQKDGTFKIINEPENGSFSELVDPAWQEFRSQVKSSNEDVDLHFINNNLEDAFYGFFNNYLEFLTESSVELSEFEMDSFYVNDLESIVDDTIETHPLRDEDLFREEILEYLEEPSDVLLDLVNEFYMTAINIDLLSREKHLDFGEIPGSGKLLILDTNVLVALLCDTDNSNPLAESVCKRSNEIGFDLVYTSDTRDELNRFIHGSKREMDGFRDGDKEFEAIRSQFVHDFLNRDSISWEDYVSEINDWQRLLRLNWGITELEDTVGVDSGVYEFAYDTLRQLERTQEEKMRESRENKFNHDANIISIVTALQEKEARNVELGPYLLTLHNKITTLSEIGREDYWDRRVALQLRTWLNYLATFTPSDLADTDYKEVATAIIESSRTEDPNIDSISDYSRLIAPKAGLESREEDILADYFVNHPLSREMEKALENDRGDQAERLAKEMLEDDERLDRFAELESQEEKVEQLRESLSDVRQRWESEKERREQLEEVLESQNKLEINITNTAQANASAHTEVEKLNEEINEFIDLLDTRLPEGYEQSDLPAPPNSDASIEDTCDWLRELKLSIASTAAVSALEPYAETLLNTATSLG